MTIEKMNEAIRMHNGLIDLTDLTDMLSKTGEILITCTNNDMDERTFKIDGEDKKILLGIVKSKLVQKEKEFENL